MNPLHAPLTLLPGPVPSGAPIVWPSPSGDSTSIVGPTRQSREFDHIPGWLLDLTPPPLDAQGWPTRVDALPIVVGMIARMMGHPDGMTVFRTGTMRPTAWGLETWPIGANISTFTLFTHDIGAPHDGTTHGGWTMAATEQREILRRLPRIPAIASINPTDPLADRLAAVAILTAKPWEKQ